MKAKLTYYSEFKDIQHGNMFIELPDDLRDYLFSNNSTVYNAIVQHLIPDRNYKITIKIETDGSN